jgi:ATP-dependent helicase/nuclease subunit A
VTPEDPPGDWPPRLETKRARIPPGARVAWPEALRAPLGEAPPPDEATRAQIEAADPDASAWVSANAGSGKTRVLTDRVARLLLRGVSPGRVLCLTYTKAAAAEMQLRLFKRLGAWSMLDDAALEAELRGLGAEIEDRAVDLDRARRLFAQAIETPGGLKIQTIHAFCAALLRRFPLEAGVSPRFEEMDDAAALLLRDEVLQEVASGPDRDALDAVARHFTGETLGDLAAQILRHRDAFEGAVPLDAALGLPPGFDAGALTACTFEGGEAGMLAEVARRMEGGGKTDRANAPVLAALARGPLDAAALPALEGLLLTKGGAAPFSPKIGKFPTKTVRAADGFPAEALDALMERVAEARPLRLALAVAERSRALHRFARTLIAAMDAAKARRALLDFDDLVLRTRALLRDPSVASWVLYKLDGGIDHILVDEAQDTSPAQWNVIEALAEEFTSGRGARDDPRSIFVVGDPKQSIYSFQGAAPREFAAQRERFAARLAEIGQPLREVALRHSFRSSPAILRAVDAMVGAAPELADPGDRKGHLAFHEGLPGRVDLWPIVAKPEAGERQAWTDPTDRVAENDARVRLAEAVVNEIARMIDQEVEIPAGEGGALRPVRAGDFLILVRSRDVLFHEIIRRAKAARPPIPVAGADRLRVGGELAVRDIGSVLAHLALPQDDLSLAEALRSPLLGWSERELYELAARRPRGGTLDDALRRRRADNPRTARMLEDLRGTADFLRPHDLIERILTRHRGRERLIARLGPEAEEGIDALLGLALRYEALEVPTLTGFVSRLREDASEIKRQAEGAGDLMRVMTVHGAKGLEAPIVVLPQTDDGMRRGGATVLPTEAGPVWAPGKAETPPSLEAAREEARAAEEAERLRLLYVAMTRAETWLIVAGARSAGEDSWHARAEGALGRLGAVPAPFPTGEGLRYEVGSWSGDGAPPEARVRPPPAALPEWASRAPRPAPEPERPHSPSALGGAKALPGEDGSEEDARARGIWIHRLLQHLPAFPEVPPMEVARDLLLEADPPAEEGELPALVAEARAILGDPALRFVFGPGTLAEVEVAARIGIDGTTRPVLGAVDRLVVERDRVLVVDFKTNRAVPDRAEDVPLGIRRQMAAYVAALREVYPGRPVEAAVLWTRGRALMPLPPEILAQAL